MSKSHEHNIIEATKQFNACFTAQEIYIVILMDRSVRHKPPFRKVVWTLARSKDLDKEKLHGTYIYWRTDKRK